MNSFRTGNSAILFTDAFLIPRMIPGTDKGLNKYLLNGEIQCLTGTGLRPFHNFLGGNGK